MNTTEAFAIGFAAGAATLYVLDPERGRRRRALVRDQVVHTGHVIDDAARSGSRHLRNQAVGLAHEARAGVTPDHADDRVIEERVRSAIGRTVSNPASVLVSADSGHVTLSGVVPSTEVQDLVRTARGVSGVDGVDNLLRVETDPSRTPGLQGTGRSQ